MYSRKDDDRTVIGFSNADWADDVNDRKSTSSYLFIMNGAPISWKTKQQTCVAFLTAEAEYIALVIATQEATWPRQPFKDLHNEQA